MSYKRIASRETVLRGILESFRDLIAFDLQIHYIKPEQVEVHCEMHIPLAEI